MKCVIRSRRTLPPPSPPLPTPTLPPLPIYGGSFCYFYSMCWPFCYFFSLFRSLRVEVTDYLVSPAGREARVGVDPVPRKQKTYIFAKYGVPNFYYFFLHVGTFLLCFLSICTAQRIGLQIILRPPRRGGGDKSMHSLPPPPESIFSLYQNQNQNQNQNNFISETYNVSNIKINLLLMGANSWKPI